MIIVIPENKGDREFHCYVCGMRLVRVPFFVKGEMMNAWECPNQC